jgi:hypothetical protein
MPWQEQQIGTCCRLSNDVPIHSYALMPELLSQLLPNSVDQADSVRSWQSGFGLPLTCCSGRDDNQHLSFCAFALKACADKSSNQILYFVLEALANTYRYPN